MVSKWCLLNDPRINSVYICSNDRYNWIRNYSLPVEFELLKDEIDKVDQLIRTGQENYNWNSPGKIFSHNRSYAGIQKHSDIIPNNKLTITYKFLKSL